MIGKENKKEWFFQKKWLAFGIPISIVSVIAALLIAGPTYWRDTMSNIMSNIKIYSQASEKASHLDLKGAASALIMPESENKNLGNCSDLAGKWEPDSNTRFEDNKIKLKAGVSAGTIFLKENPKSLLNLRILFKSSMKTGINTNISFENGNDEIKYAIGDGDFKTVRYYRSDNNGPTYILKNETRLKPEVDNQYGVEFTMGIVKQSQGNKMLGSLIYGKDGEYTSNLQEITIEKPERISLTVGFGLESRKESENNRDNAYVELESCEISE